MIAGPRGYASLMLTVLQLRGFIDSEHHLTPAGRHALRQHNAHKKRNA